MTLTLDGSLIAIFFIFWGTFLLLKKLYFEPYRRAIEEREGFLAEKEEVYTRALAAFEEKTRLIREELEKARREALEEVDKIRKEAERAKEEKLRVLREALAQEERKFREKIQEEIRKTRESLRGNVEWIAQEIEKKLLSW